jgi:hypothetical protein
MSVETKEERAEVLIQEPQLLLASMPPELKNVDGYNAFVKDLERVLEQYQQPIQTGESQVPRNYHSIRHPLGMLEQARPIILNTNLPIECRIAIVIAIVFHDEEMSGLEITRDTNPLAVRMNFDPKNEEISGSDSVAFIDGHLEFLNKAKLDIDSIKLMTKESVESTKINRDDFFQAAVNKVDEMVPILNTREKKDKTEDDIKFFLQRLIVLATLAVVDLRIPLESHNKSRKAATEVLIEESLSQLLMLVPALAPILASTNNFTDIINGIKAKLDIDHTVPFDYFESWIKEKVTDPSMAVNRARSEWQNRHLLYNNNIISITKVVLTKVTRFLKFQPILAQRLIGNFSRLRNSIADAVNLIKDQCNEVDITPYKSALESIFEPIQGTLDHPFQYCLESQIINLIKIRHIKSESNLEKQLDNTVFDQDDQNKIVTFASALATKINDYLSLPNSDSFKSYPIAELLQIQQAASQFNIDNFSVLEDMVTIVLDYLGINCIDDINKVNIDNLNFASIFLDNSPLHILKLIKYNDMVEAMKQHFTTNNTDRQQQISISQYLTRSLDGCNTRKQIIEFNPKIEIEKYQNKNTN